LQEAEIFQSPAKKIENNVPKKSYFDDEKLALELQKEEDLLSNQALSVQKGPNTSNGSSVSRNKTNPSKVRDSR
jgi:hypothetical protein